MSWSLSLYRRQKRHGTTVHVFCSPGKKRGCRPEPDTTIKLLESLFFQVAPGFQILGWRMMWEGKLPVVLFCGLSFCWYVLELATDLEVRSMLIKSTPENTNGFPTSTEHQKTIEWFQSISGLERRAQLQSYRSWWLRNSRSTSWYGESATFTKVSNISTGYFQGFLKHQPMTPNVWNMFSSYVPLSIHGSGGCFSDGKCSSPVEHLGLVYIKKHGNFLFNEPLMGEGLPGLHFVAPVDPKQIQDCPVSFEKLAV